MKLYGTPPTRALRVQWLLNELGRLRGHRAQSDGPDPEFLALNPAGKVPVLADGDVVLTESAAIPLYLAEKFPEKDLIPRDFADRAQMYRWMFFLVTEIEQPLWRIALNTFIYAEEDQVPADIANATRDCKKMVAVFEKHMAGREYVVGDKLSVVVGKRTEVAISDSNDDTAVHSGEGLRADVDPPARVQGQGAKKSEQQERPTGPSSTGSTDYA